MEDLFEFFQTSICKILFPYTVELAKKGHFKEAEASLKFMLDHDPSPEYDLLLGKIYAQQGRYKDAILEWKRVLERDPENQEARRAILRAEELSKRILPPQLFKWRLITGILGFLLVLSLGMGFSLWKGKIDISSQYKDSLKENQALSANYQELNEKVKEAKKEVDVSGNRYQELARNHEEITIKNKDLLESYENLERQIGEQIVIALKGGYHLTRIKGVGDSDIALKLTDKAISVYGEVPTEYLRKLIEKTVKGIKSVESVDIKGLKVTHSYVVVERDTLSEISEKNYGDARVKNIQEANPDKIKDPDKIYKGDTLHMP